MFTATLFDYNGVLVDDELVHLEAFRDVLAPLGFQISQEQYWQEYLGFDDAGVFRTVLERAGQNADAARIAELIAAKKPCYLARARGTLRGFPGASELVRARAAAGPVVIVSGALRDEIELGLDVLGVRSCVSEIVSAEDAPNSKPHPQGYLLGIAALQRLGVSEATRQAVVFEDSLDGVAAALAAGLTCVGIAHSYPVNELQATGAQCVVERIEQVTAELLQQTWQQSQSQ